MVDMDYDEWQKREVQRYKDQYLATLHELEERAERFIDEVCADCDTSVEITIRIDPTEIVNYSIKREKIAREIIHPKNK